MEHQESLEKFFNISIFHNFPVAIWKNPKETEIKAVAGKELIKLNQKFPDIETDLSQFVIAPFLKTKPNYSIPFSIILEVNKNNLIFSNNDLYALNASEAIRFKDFYYNENTIDIDFAEEVEMEDTSKELFLSNVEKAKSNIESGIFKKVVLARKKKIATKNKINLIEKLLMLSNQYPDAFVWLLHSQETGTWMGASPEILVSLNKEKVFQTIALAGTQKIDSSQKSQSIVWTQKEIEEQALVGRYIINCFKSIRLREYEDYGPRTVFAGSLAHLQTDFIVNLHEVKFPNLGNTMLALLHPTSAVCGMPKAEALDFLAQHEQIDRDFYAGFVGPINDKNTSNLYVNIRCAKIFKNSLILFAGAGITTESVAEKEFEETEAKMETIGKIFLE